MTTAFDLVTIDAPRPDVLAAFWRTALGLVELEREDGDRWIVIGHASGDRVLGIQRGTARPGGVHLDLACSPEEFDDELLKELEVSLEETTDRTPRRSSPPSLDDEMTKLLGELSTPRR